MEVVNVVVTDSPEVVAVNVAVGFGTVVNSDSTYSATVNSGDTLVVPDTTWTDSDGTPMTTPATLPIVCTPPVTLGVDIVNSDLTLNDHANDGDTYVVADTIVKNTLGTTILTQPSATDGVIADSVVTNSDATFSLAVPAETNPVLADITHIDSDLTPVVLPAMTPMVCTPSAAPTYASARVMKTGQTTSYRTGDDGDIEAGREDDFFTLKENNPFGNTNRFTDELGGQTYTNNIVIDWSTFDGVSVLGYYRNFSLNSNWAAAIDTCLALSIGTFISGWHLANRKELENIVNSETALPFNYAPFNNSSSIPVCCSTTVKSLTGYSYRIDQYHQLTSVSKNASAGNLLAVRTFTVSGTTLT